MKIEAKQWIEFLHMEKHPEGGYYKSSFTSINQMEFAAHDGERPLYTSIYFLLRSEDLSHFHRLKSDELWYFHAGSALTVHMIDEEGEYRQERLGIGIADGGKPQVLVKKGSIFGSTVDSENSFSLVGCMVATGFDFKDFELFTQQQLMQDYPQHQEIIERLAYEDIP